MGHSEVEIMNSNTTQDISCNCNGNHTMDTAGRWYCPIHGYVPSLTSVEMSYLCNRCGKKTLTLYMDKNGAGVCWDCKKLII